MKNTVANSQIQFHHAMILNPSKITTKHILRRPLACIKVLVQILYDLSFTNRSSHKHLFIYC